ncbi:hypothetical protein QPK13_18020 [Photorhabdus tasmaniensis]
MPLFLLLTGWGATGCIKPEKSGEISRSYFLFGQPKATIADLNSLSEVGKGQIVSVNAVRGEVKIN